MAAEAGANLVGLVGPMPTGPGVQSLETCNQIAKACPTAVTPVLLTSSETVEAIAADVTAAGVQAVQVVRHVHPSVHQRLADLAPGVKRIQVIHVEGNDALDLIAVYQDHVDAFLLDSGKPSSEELGGTGRVHDWQISRAFVQASPRPVFLAGGLTPENAARAVAEVQPYGLDICSGLRVDDRLDAGLLAAFMAEIAAGDAADVVAP